LCDQALREVGVYAPVSAFVGIGQRRAFDWRANAHVLQFRRLRRQADCDIAQALAVGQLLKGQNAEETKQKDTYFI
jgi:hypothetical protein